MSNRSKLFAKYNPGGVFTVTDVNEIPHDIFFVDSVNGSTNYSGKDPDHAKATVNQAVALCTASKGDVIYCMPGHAETIIAAGGVALSTIGVKLVGLGEGSLRPTFSFTTANSATFLISAAACSVENCIFDMTGKDGITGPLAIQAAGFTLKKCEIEFADSSGQAVNAIVTTAAANDLTIEDCYMFGSADAGTANAIEVVGGDSIVIRRNTIVGAFTTTLGGIENKTTAATNLQIENNYIDNRTASSTIAVTIKSDSTGVIRGNHFSILSGSTPVVAAAMVWGGGNTFTNAVATEAVQMAVTDSALNLIGVNDNDNAVTTSAVVANADGSVLERIEYLQDALTQTAGLATFPAGVAAADTVSIAEVIRYVQENIIVGAGTALPAAHSLWGALAGATGIGTWPSAAAPATTVSLAGAIRYIADNLINGTGTATPTNTSLFDALAGAKGITTWPSAATPATTVSLAGALRYLIDNVIKGTGTALPADSSLWGTLAGATGITTWPDAATPATTVSLAGAIRYLVDNVQNGGTALPATCSIYDLLAGANGVPVYPAAALPANNVSIAEVLREVYDQAEKSVVKAAAVIAAGTATAFTVAGGPIIVTHLVAVCVTENDATATLLKFTADPTNGAAVDLCAASATLASATAGTVVNIDGTVGSAPVISANGVAIGQAAGILVPAGVIQTITSGGVTTGTWTIHLRYKPLARGVTVV